jgi:hypothetical protein
MGTTIALPGCGSLFNIAQFAEIYGTWPIMPFRASGTFRKNLAEALVLTERCETTPHAGIAG